LSENGFAIFQQPLDQCSTIRFVVHDEHLDTRNFLTHVGLALRSEGAGVTTFTFWF
jgi:hypothetical protein